MRDQLAPAMTGVLVLLLVAACSEPRGGGDPAPTPQDASADDGGLTQDTSAPQDALDAPMGLDAHASELDDHVLDVATESDGEVDAEEDVPGDVPGDAELLADTVDDPMAAPNDSSDSSEDPLPRDDADPADAGDDALVEDGSGLDDTGDEDTTADVEPLPDAGEDFPAEVGTPASGDDRVTVGQGRLELVALRHGDEVRWERGPQRGHHIYLRWESDVGWLDGLSEAERSTLRWEMRVEDRVGTRLASLQRTGGIRVGEDGVWRSDLAQVILVNGVRPGGLDGSPLRVAVRIWGTALPEEVTRWVWVRSACCD